MWAVLMVISFIFTSIALLLSTKISSGATIGISIGIGVIVPVTGLISLFTIKPEYNKVENRKVIAFSSSFDQTKGMIEKQMKDKGVDHATTAKVTSFIDSISALYDPLFKELNSEKNGLLNLGISAGGSDSFKTAWVTDLSFQIKKLSSFASEQVVPDQLKQVLQSSAKYGGGQFTTRVIDGSENFNAKKMSDLLVKEIKAFFTVEETLKKNKVGIIALNELIGHRAKGYIWGRDLTQPSSAYSTAKDIASPLFEFNQHRTPIEKMIFNVHAISNSPLSFIFNKTKLEKLIGKHSDEIYKDDSLKFTNIFTGNDRWLWYKNNPGEMKIYNSLVLTAQANPNAIKIVESVEYVSRNTILWIYLAISALLLPLTYLVIRRQDFR